MSHTSIHETSTSPPAKADDEPSSVSRDGLYNADAIKDRKHKEEEEGDDDSREERHRKRKKRSKDEDRESRKHHHRDRDKDRKKSRSGSGKATSKAEEDSAESIDAAASGNRLVATGKEEDKDLVEKPERSKNEDEKSRSREKDREKKKRSRDGGEGDERSVDEDRKRHRDRSSSYARGDRRYDSRDRDGRRDRDHFRRRGSRDRRERDPGRTRSERDRSASVSPPSRARRRYRSSSSRDRRDRYRGRDRRRARSPSSSDSDRDRKHDQSSSTAEATDQQSNVFKPVTLKEIITANPGMSMPEAIIRLNAHNSALAKGIAPPPLSAAQGAGSAAVLPTAGSLGTLGVGGLGLVAEGGPATKPHRELYVGNLPPGITAPQLTEFVNTAFKQLGLAKDDIPVVINCWLSPDNHYAFVELRTIDYANAAMTYLNGVQVGAYNLKFGRPKGYTGPAGAGAPGLGAANPLLAGFQGAGIGLAGSSLNPATIALGAAPVAGPMSNAVMVTNLPSLITEDQVKELFSQFGALKAFNSIKTAGSETQTAVLEFEDGSIVDGVVAGMNQLDIAGNKLSVQRIPVSSAEVLLKPMAKPVTSSSPNGAAWTSSAPEASNANGTASGADADDIISEELKSLPASTVLCLGNMVTSEDLSDDQLYEELTEDVSDECNRYGTVRSIVIPRSGEDSSVGRIFVYFTDIKGAQDARKAVEGRKFNGRVVKAFFYPEELFKEKVYVVPNGYVPRGDTELADPFMPDDIEHLD